MKDDQDKSREQELNPENEYQNSVPHKTEIEQPVPSTVTVPIPQEMPVRQG